MICVAELCISGSFNGLILLSDNTRKYQLPDEVTMPSYANNPMCFSLTKQKVNKNSAIPFFTDLNNVHTILMRKVSQFRFSIHNQCISIYVVFKVR